MKERIYWLNGFSGEAKGGLYYRAFALIDFVQKVEIKGMKVVGIKMDESKNIELLYE